MSAISIYELGSKVAVLKQGQLIPSLYDPKDVNLKRVDATTFRAEVKNTELHTGTFDTFGSNKTGKDTVSEVALIERFSQFGLSNDAPNFYKYLEKLLPNGDLTGIIGANENYSTETLFAVKHTVGENPIFINRLITTIADSGSLDAGRYGNGLSLNNGLLVQKIDASGNVLIDLTGGVPIKNNTDWGTNCYDVKTSEFGSGDNYVLSRWTLSKDSNAKGMKLEDGEQIVVKIGIDNLSGLTGHKFKAVGTVNP